MCKGAGTREHQRGCWKTRGLMLVQWAFPEDKGSTPSKTGIVGGVNQIVGDSKLQPWGEALEAEHERQPQFERMYEGRAHKVCWGNSLLGQEGWLRV